VTFVYAACGATGTHSLAGSDLCGIHAGERTRADRPDSPRGTSEFAVRLPHDAHLKRPHQPAHAEMRAMSTYISMRRLAYSLMVQPTQPKLAAIASQLCHGSGAKPAEYVQRIIGRRISGYAQISLKSGLVQLTVPGS
jgi:hypothetical protein